MRKINVFQNHMMRWISGSRQRDCVRIVELERVTGLKPIESIIKKQQMKWFGHIKRSALPIK